MKTRYHIDPNTLSLKKVNNVREFLKHSAIYIISGLLIGALCAFLAVSFIPSPREKELLAKNEILKSEYQLLEHRIDQLQLITTDLQQRDDNLYRVLLQVEPVPLSVRMNTNTSAAVYDSIAQLADYQLIGKLTAAVDVLEKELYMQAKSYEEIVELVKTHEIRIENIPAIQPVLNKDLTRVASGYGYRIDPVYHTQRFHAGMDFTAPTGTDVYATGNGTVTFVGWRQGYGNAVVIDHGFGYETLYAHLHKAIVKKGQKVKRGDVIALVGNTGKSTGPHLHYEVHLHGKAIDPRNYYFQDLSPEEYDRMVQLSNNFGNLLD